MNLSLAFPRSLPLRREEKAKGSHIKPGEPALSRVAPVESKIDIAQDQDCNVLSDPASEGNSVQNNTTREGLRRHSLGESSLTSICAHHRVRLLGVRIGQTEKAVAIRVHHKAASQAEEDQEECRHSQLAS